MWLVVPDGGSHMTYSKNIWVFINCVCLQGFPIDSCAFAGELDV